MEWHWANPAKAPKLFTRIEGRPTVRSRNRRIVADLNHDGTIDASELRFLGLASTVIPFHINGAGK